MRTSWARAIHSDAKLANQRKGLLIAQPSHERPLARDSNRPDASQSFAGETKRVACCSPLERMSWMRDNPTLRVSPVALPCDQSARGSASRSYGRLRSNVCCGAADRRHVERFIQSLKHECLNKFVIVAPRHLNHVNREWRLHFNRERPHSARNHLPRGLESPPDGNSTIPLSNIVCHTRLGGLLKSYERRVA